MSYDQNLQIRQCDLPQQIPLTINIAVTCDEYITIFSLKQDAQTALYY